MPQRDVHGARLALVRARRVRKPLEQRVVDAERFGEPLAVAALELVVGLRVRLVALEDDVVGGVGIVDPRVRRAARLRIVRRAPLRHQAEPVLARVVVCDQRLERRFSPSSSSDENRSAEDQQAVEAGARLRGAQVECDPHADGDGSLEIGDPGQVVVQYEVVAVTPDLLVDRQGRIGRDGKPIRDRACRHRRAAFPPLNKSATKRSGSAAAVGARVQEVAS